jgi:hypothetical protein
MPTIRSIIRKYDLKDLELFATALRYAKRERDFTILFKAKTFEEAIEILKWELSSISSIETDLREMRVTKDNWDLLQRNTYNIQLGDLNERKKKLDNALSSLIVK